MWISISEKYECSDDGHVRNKKTRRVLHEFVGKDGYLRTQFEGKTRTIHRVIAKAFISNPNNLAVVNHIDGNKQNNNVNNLEWCTSSENQKHAYKKGLRTAPKGTKNGRCKLTVDDINYIKTHYKKGDVLYGAKALAEKFKVAPQTISAVNSGQNWK
jgi:hypothetical protein